jgi:hypothetical protein
MSELEKDPKANDDPTGKSPNDSPEGVTPSTSGDGAEPAKDQPYSKSFVDKLLSEKKNVSTSNQALQKQIEDLQKQVKDRNESDLREQNKWKELHDLKEQERDQWRAKYDDQNKTIVAGLKNRELRGELAKLGIKQSYVEKAVKLADLESIKVDPETNIVIGADSQAKLISEEWSDLFGGGDAGANHDAPAAVSTPITLEDWKKLSPEEKKKRKADLFKSMGHELKK